MTFVKVNNPLQKSVNNVFDELFNELPNFWNKEVKNSFNQPPANIVETANGYNLEINAPGRNKEDFKISVDNGLLTISYEKKAETKSEDAKSVRTEFSLQSFKRSFTLDDKLKADGIEAKYENGILKLFVPKKEEVKETAREISVQ
ncbi:Hsp20/alpha crystallin family protein [Pinibacter soli]|uniref:Hsp20/alpha crystallin family protein n=1 Tax=Pinibacter soli TaxID=3044211 RepID=A0ABT6RCW0_9BACT|nr:Hsp20/alpha crystallin family protein [Pinibacter soli]MDI3320411.1 Hsp20/alpha crystallin family protein [Pinibacter soli]